MDLAAAAAPQTFQDLNRGCFARAIRPQQSENFTGLYVQIDAANGFDISVRLDEPLYRNRVVCLHSFCPVSRRAIGQFSMGGKCRRATSLATHPGMPGKMPVSLPARGM